MSFNANTVINHSSYNTTNVFYVGFDLGRYQNSELTEILMDVIVDFAFGYHTGILKTYNRKILKEAAKAIYKINEFKEVKWVYVDNDSELLDCELKAEKKYLKKGEFGEMILHLLLRDFFKTQPLISKIHFKDTDNAVVHGFDIVHIGKDLNDPDKDSLFLGESKLYSRKTGHAGIFGINDLVEDLKNHFNTDFLYREIALIGKKKNAYTPIDEYPDLNTKEEYEHFFNKKNEWYDILKKVENKESKLQDFFKSVTIPLICTYQSDIFIDCDDVDCDDFQDKISTEVKKLKDEFDEKLKNLPIEVGEPKKTELNVVLLLFPIPSKKELIKVLHEKLFKEQG